MYKEELKNIYYLVFCSFLMLIITYITDDIAIGLGVSLPLFLILIAFVKKTKK
ncbi:hypothetical protein [Enterococcus lemanii]|jgi:hypothetical protein|uniref:Uncharacterized protein n=1 Tax=Enterococcus lemanii TaxID=1159752 RepID=A0ABV9MU67_9ENTE|nr:hypothetical protein [Enterococcus lemanii]MBM7708956.1 hypothetical protein [Enterococcus lemanii]